MSKDTSRVRLTAGRVEAFTCPSGKSQAFLWDTEAPSLMLRATPTGRKTFAFEGRLNGGTIRVSIGTAADWSLDAARKRAAELKQQVDSGHDPRDLERQKQSARAAVKAAALAAEQFNLRALLDDYIAHQKAIGRSSHRDAATIFKLHVFGPWPKLAKLPANQVTGEHIADMMRRVIENGHGRTANKLRSYVRAAFQMAKAARSKPTIPVRFKDYMVTANPADDTAPDESANKPDKRPLTLAELRVYWQAIKGLEGFKGAVLRLHLLTGGQRIEQLVKLRTIDTTAITITLLDGKGRPGKAARPHTVPLIEQAAEALRQCEPQGDYAISMSKGAKHLSADTLARWARAVATDVEAFEAKRIRSGVETALAAARVNSDTRGRLQSHGVAGVQARHYDGHDYMDEKRQALESLFALLDTPEASNVVLLNGTQRKPAA
jgi:integrase